MNATIRPARPEDLPDLTEMMAAYYRQDGLNFDPERASAVLRELMGDPRWGEVWTIEAEGRPIGYLALTFGFSLECGGRDAFVDELFLLEPFRGRGIGALTLEHPIRRCQALDIRALRLEVTQHNARALSLYRRNGFAEHGRRLMSLALSPPGKT